MNHQDLIIVPRLNHRQLDPNQSSYDYVPDLEHFQQEGQVLQQQEHLLVLLHRLRRHHYLHLRFLQHRHKRLLHVQVHPLFRERIQNNIYSKQKKK